MIANSYPVSPTFEPLLASSAEVPWFEDELCAKQAAVHGKRILLVDDQEPLRRCLRVMLELDGHQVTEASNGAEALNFFNLGDYDLVITDYQMPVMKGNELAASVKLLAPSLPILMITASERAPGDADNPVDALLNKPITALDLRCALGKLFSARTQPRAVPV